MHDSQPHLDASAARHDANLVGYLVGGLDENEQRQLEIDLEAHPETYRRLEELRLALEPLAADKIEPTAPRGLAVRTLAAIAEYSCRQLPRAPVPSAQPAAIASRSWWRRADVLVAACLLLTFLGAGIPAVLSLRASAARRACQDNLREYSNALHAYRDAHHKFPHIADAENAPHHMAGMVIPILADAGVLSEHASIRCPGNGQPLSSSVTLRSALEMPAQELAAKLSACYAYSLGYKDDAGYHPPCQAPGQSASLVALMSDSPPAGAGLGNSPNHGGHGQNVLFMDGSVRFLTSRILGGDDGDDIFTNRVHQVAAGLDCFDIVLGACSARP